MGSEGENLLIHLNDTATDVASSTPHQPDGFAPSFDRHPRDCKSFLRASAKRRWALPEGNPLSNTRRTRLHTVADRREASSSPLLTVVPGYSAPRTHGDACVKSLPVVSASWLGKLPQGSERSDEPEDSTGAITEPRGLARKDFLERSRI